MIIYTKDIENNDEFLNILKQERIVIHSLKSSQKSLKNILLDYMQKLADSTDNIDTHYTDTILKLLEDLKTNLELLNHNMEKIDHLLDLLDTISKTSDQDALPFFYECIDTFNTSFLESNEIISKNTLQIENFFHLILTYLNFIFVKPTTTSSTVCCNNTSHVSEKQEIPTEDSTAPITNNFIENTLIISETKGKIFLPYTLQLLEDTLKNNPQKYASIEDVVEKEYTLSYHSFKNATIARFRETYKLMKLREKASFFECIDLALELSLNSLLNPAVISACKNQDELDIYLDYLENNETEKFSIFQILYEIAPTIVHKK